MQHCTAWHSTAQHGTARLGTARHSTAQHGTTQRSCTSVDYQSDRIAQHSTAWHVTRRITRHSTAQHSTITYHASPACAQDCWCCCCCQTGRQRVPRSGLLKGASAQSSVATPEPSSAWMRSKRSSELEGGTGPLLGCH